MAHIVYQQHLDTGNIIIQVKLIDNNLIKSAHDVSLGGIITAIAKMCIKGKKGMSIKKPK